MHIDLLQQSSFRAIPIKAELHDAGIFLLKQPSHSMGRPDRMMVVSCKVQRVFFLTPIGLGIRESLVFKPLFVVDLKADTPFAQERFQKPFRYFEAAFRPRFNARPKPAYQPKAEPQQQKTQFEQTDLATERPNLVQKAAYELLNKVRNEFAANNAAGFDKDILAASVTEDSSAYAVLGLGHKASEREVRLAYRKLCMKLHPDKADMNGYSKKSAEEAFKIITKAYEKLTKQ